MGVEGALGYFDPGIAWFGPPEWPEDRIYEGYDGVRKAASVWTENFDGFQLDLQTAVDTGDGVVALIIQRAVIKGSGAELEHRVSWHCQLHAGRIMRVRPYFSWEEGLEAAGLAEFR
jgi:ketosteroid isomerase-like protein